MTSGTTGDSTANDTAANDGTARDTALDNIAALVQTTTAGPAMDADFPSTRRRAGGNAVILPVAIRR